MKKNKRNRENHKKQRGITLIALVITIIILLILAGVTLNITLSQNGLFQRAKIAGEKYKQSEENENTRLDEYSSEMDKITGETGGNGGIETLEEAKKKTGLFEETTEVTDGEKSMTIPAGFQITEGTSIDEGIVVQDAAGNEFVWVPVDINSMVFCQEHTSANVKYDENKKKLVCESCKSTNEEATNFAGKLYANKHGNNFTEGTPNTTYSTGNLMEPYAVSYDDTYSDSAKEDGYDNFKTQLQVEFNEMAESVGKYKGFYIGRYETSGIEDGGTPKVKKGEIPTTSKFGLNWYTMYKNSKNLVQAESKVTSSMIWGCQWDQVMLWMKNVENKTDSEKKYITDSSGMGWYNGESGNSDHKTGVDLTKNGESEVLNRVKNIYDLAGNLDEWTLEANSSNGRAIRGGYYENSGSEVPVSYRGGNSPPSPSSDTGSRIAIYLK